MTVVDKVLNFLLINFNTVFSNPLPIRRRTNIFAHSSKFEIFDSVYQNSGEEICEDSTLLKSLFLM